MNIESTRASEAQADSLCPGRYRAQLDIPEEQRKTTDAATFGTRIHDALALGKSDGLNPAEESVYEECKAIEEKIVTMFFTGTEHTVERETRIWLKFDQFEHTAKPDVVYYGTNRRALVIEYKTLAGDVPVSSSNLQLRDQVVLVNHREPKELIGAAVIQPMVTHDPEICLYMEKDIRVALDLMMARIVKSHDPNAPRIAGEVQCKFCAASGNCAAYHEWVGKQMPVLKEFTALPMTAWNAQHCAAFLAGRAIAADWLDNAYQECKRRLKVDPGAIPGWHLQPGFVREIVTNPQELFARFNRKGGTIEQFMKCVKIAKGELKTVVRDLTKEKGKKLDREIEKLTEGITESKQNDSSIEKDAT